MPRTAIERQQKVARDAEPKIIIDIPRPDRD
jgi:hypothetical protein